MDRTLDFGGIQVQVELHGSTEHTQKSVQSKAKQIDLSCFETQIRVGLFASSCFDNDSALSYLLRVASSFISTTMLLFDLDRIVEFT